MASTIASTLALSRPSEKLGTHSTSVGMGADRITGLGKRWLVPLLEPVIANGELQASVDAGIAVANAGIREVKELPGERHRLLRLQEVMEAAANTVHEIEAGGTGDREVVRCHEESAGKLGERRKA